MQHDGTRAALDERDAGASGRRRRTAVALCHLQTGSAQRLVPRTKRLRGHPREAQQQVSELV